MAADCMCCRWMFHQLHRGVLGGGLRSYLERGTVALPKMWSGVIAHNNISKLNVVG